MDPWLDDRHVQTLVGVRGGACQTDRVTIADGTMVPTEMNAEKTGKPG